MTTLILLWSAAVLASSTRGEPDERNQEGTHYLIEVSDQGERAHCVDIEGNRRDKGEKWMEGCNTCVCSMFSLTRPTRKGECTRTDGCGDPRQCVDIRGNLREPGEKWKNPGDCNTCTCGLAVPGTASCTEMGCLIPRECVDIEGNRRDEGEKWKEGCNTCICSRFSLTHGGVGECTRTDGCGDPRQCVDIRGNLREPGEKWKNFGDCNTCTCGGGFEPGTVSCTEKGCTCLDSEGNRRDEGEKWKEGCNTCVCSMFSITHRGVPECTRTDGCGDPRQCVDSRGNLREPGEKWKNPGDCNTCTCGLGFEPGMYSCTEIGCQDDSILAPDWPRQVQKEQEQVGWGN